MGQTFSAFRCWSADPAKAADAFDDIASSPLAPGPEVARLGADLLARLQPSSSSSSSSYGVSPHAVYVALAQIAQGVTPGSVHAREFARVLGAGAGEDDCGDVRELHERVKASDGVELLVASSIFARSVPRLVDDDDGGDDDDDDASSASSAEAYQDAVEEHDADDLDDDDDDDDDVDSVASSIDIVKPTYVRALSERLGARSKTLGHNAVAVNAFIASRTDGRVNRIVDDDVLNDANGRTLLLVAATGPNDEDIQACVMMRAKLKTPHVVMWDKSEAVALEYGGGGGGETSAATPTRAVLYLPPTDEASHVSESGGGGDWSSASDAARAMTPGKWSSISAQASRPDARREIDVSVPKFTVSAGPMDLKPALRSIGLNAVFDRPGGLTALSDDEEMTLREVRHEVVVDVDEGEAPDDDARAAGAAAAAAAGESKPSKTPRTRVVFDRPFLFFIEDARSRALLFAGVVNAPGVVA